MKPLLILISVFVISLLTFKLLTGRTDLALSGRIAMAAMLLFTTIGHFAFPKGMAMMVPPFIPFKTAMVYWTGIFEIAAAIGLLIPRFSQVTGWWLILFFILLLPANIYAALKHIDYQKGTFDGNGPTYLYFRIPLQVLFIVWTCLSAIKG